MFDLIEKLYICLHTSCLDCPDCPYYHLCLMPDIYNDVRCINENLFSIHYADGEI